MLLAGFVGSGGLVLLAGFVGSGGLVELVGCCKLVFTETGIVGSDNPSGILVEYNVPRTLVYPSGSSGVVEVIPEGSVVGVDGEGVGEEDMSSNVDGSGVEDGSGGVTMSIRFSKSPGSPDKSRLTK